MSYEDCIDSKRYMLMLEDDYSELALLACKLIKTICEDCECHRCGATSLCRDTKNMAQVLYDFDDDIKELCHD